MYRGNLQKNPSLGQKPRTNTKIVSRRRTERIKQNKWYRTEQ